QGHGQLGDRARPRDGGQAHLPRRQPAQERHAQRGTPPRRPHRPAPPPLPRAQHAPPHRGHAGPPAPPPGFRVERAAPQRPRRRHARLTTDCTTHGPPRTGPPRRTLLPKPRTVSIMRAWCTGTLLTTLLLATRPAFAQPAPAPDRFVHERWT